MHKVEHDVAPTHADVFGMEVTLVDGVGEQAHIALHAGLNGQSFLHYQGATRLHEGREVLKSLAVFRLGLVDVEVVGIGGGDDGHIKG